MKLEKKHWYWIAGITAAAIGLGIYAYRRNKKKKAEAALGEAETTKPTTTKQQPSQSKSTSAAFPLKMGSKGYGVKVMQQYMNTTCPKSLKEAGVFPLKVDGIWGNKTQAGALKCYVLQRDKIDELTYKRAVRDLKVANVLPKA